MQVEPPFTPPASINTCSEYVATIQRFVETRRAYEWGLVAQALAGAMRHVLQVGRSPSHRLEHMLLRHKEWMDGGPSQGR